MSASFPENAQLAVLSQSGHTLSFFGLGSGARTALVPLLPEGHELLFDPGRRVVYASHTYRSGYFAAHSAKGHEVSVTDVDTHQVRAVFDLAPEHAPHALALPGPSAPLYVSVEEGPAGPGGLVAIDPDSGAVGARYSSEAPVPHWAVVAPDGRTAYSANKNAPFVSVIDLAGERPARRVPVPGSENLTLSPTGDLLYVATPTAVQAPAPDAPNAVLVIDTETLATVATLPVPAKPSPVHVTATGTLLVGSWPAAPSQAIPFAEGIVSLFDTATRRPLGEVTVGVAPINIVSTPDGHYAFVSNLISGTVSVIDLTTATVVSTLEVDNGRPDGDLTRNTHNQGAHGMAYIPAAPAETG